MWKIIALCITITGLAADNVTNVKASYENYKVFRIHPRTYMQLEVLQDLKNSNEMFHRLQIRNVQELINNTISQNQSQNFNFNSYHALEKIYDNLDELAKKYPGQVQVIVGGTTYEGREIKGVKVSISNQTRPGIFIEGGIHAREWISPATVMYILHQLLFSNDTDVRYIADNHNWFIFPIFNPDGYVYSFTKDRLWTKNRKPSSSFCIGSNLNRNWDFQWNKLSGLSTNYVANVVRTPIVYLYKLHDKSEYGFLLPPKQIIPTGKKTLDFFIAMCNETLFLLQQLLKIFLYRDIMWKLTVLSTIVIIITAQKATYDNYKVFRITPTTQKHITLLRELTKFRDRFIFWEAPVWVNMTLNLMIVPNYLPQFYEVITEIGAPYYINIENVQTLIDQTMPRYKSTFDFKSYHSLEIIYNNMDDLAKRYPNKVKIIVGGKTYEKRQIKGVQVSFKANNPGIFLEGGIHAREWISPATVMYILHQLLTSNNSDIRNLADSHEWYIFPLFNPDGYVYTHKMDRLWRKNRKPQNLFCVGTDLNRNWNYKWNTTGVSKNPCFNSYPGTKPFSEIETKSLSKYIQSISNKFYAYISFHSFKQLLMFPYGYTKAHLDNYDELYAIGLKAIAVLKKKYGTEYRIGNIAETIYLASGTTTDYIKGTYNKHIVYIYELRDRGDYGFLLPPDQIIPTGVETLDSLVTIFKEISMYQKYVRNDL
ncbi:CBPA1 carboxypeptidase, partial [Acromyrmex heyeri]